jgi:hypothetical protein
MKKFGKVLYDLTVNIAANYLGPHLRFIAGLLMALCNFFTRDHLFFSILSVGFFVWALIERRKRRELESDQKASRLREEEAKRQQKKEIERALWIDYMNRRFRQAMARKKRKSMPPSQRFCKIFSRISVNR